VERWEGNLVAQAPSMSLVEVRHASMIFGADETATRRFEDTSFEVEAGAFVCIVDSYDDPN
jgi:hypothetical protein